MAGFADPYYEVTIESGDKVRIDVTHSISAGLPANKTIEATIIPWMKDRGYTRVLDFGAGALRHTIPFLKAGFEVISVEYKQAFERPKTAEILGKYKGHENLTRLVWPADFIKARVKYDVALLLYVIQVIPDRRERAAVLEAIAKHFDPNGPKRLYYASRAGLKTTMLPENKIKSRLGSDGWAMGRGTTSRTFFTEWNAADTNAFFKDAHFERVGSYEGIDQGFIFDYSPGGVT